MKENNFSLSDISQDVLNVALEMVVYLNFCPPEYKELVYFSDLILNNPRDIFMGK